MSAAAVVRSLLIGLASWTVAARPPVAAQELTPSPVGPLHVERNLLVDAAGHPILLRGTELPVTPETSAPGQDFGPLSATTLHTIRQRWNMNAVRLPVDASLYLADPAYRRALSSAVRWANDFGLVIILASQSSPGKDTALFWKLCAARFHACPRLIFAVDAGPTALPELVSVIRSQHAPQPILVPENAPTSDPNILYEFVPRLPGLRTDEDRSHIPGASPSPAPLLARWDLSLDGPDCPSLPPDPAGLERLIQSNLAYFDNHHISWIASVFRPGKLVHNYRNYEATTVENGWTCGQPNPVSTGIGIAVQFHLWRVPLRGLITVNGPTGGLLLPRGGIAIAYGPILAGREAHRDRDPLPKRLANVSVRVTDSRGTARLAGLLHTLAGWGQVNFVVPPECAPGPAEIAIVRTDGTVTTGPAIIADVAPGLWTVPSNGRGPVVAEVTQRFADGAEKRSSAGVCRLARCLAIPIALSPGVATTVRLFGTGFRFARSPGDLQVKLGGVPLPVASFGPVDLPGIDQITVQLPDSLPALGESDLTLWFRGRPANVARIGLVWRKR